MGEHNTTASVLQLQDRDHNNLFQFHKKLSGCVPKNIYVLKKCSKFTGEQPGRSVISIKLQNSFIKIALRYWCSPVNLLHISEHYFLSTPLKGCFRDLFKFLFSLILFIKFFATFLITLSTNIHKHFSNLISLICMIQKRLT